MQAGSGGTGEGKQLKPTGGGRGRGARRDDDVDMEVTFASGLETLGERLAAKRAPKQAETVWEQYLRRRRCPLCSAALKPFSIKALRRPAVSALAAGTGILASHHNDLTHEHGFPRNVHC